MKNKLFKITLLLPVLLLVSSCSDSESKPTGETLSSLRAVRPGSGGQCVSLDFTHQKCVDENKELLVDDNQTVTEEADPLILATDSSGRQIYEMKYNEPNPISLASITKALVMTDRDLLATAILTYIESKIYSFMMWMSEGGIIADGSIQDYTMSMFGQSLPIKYVVDCTGDSTTFHILVGDEGMKLKVKSLEDGTYEIKTHQISDDGKRVVTEKGYCIPMTIEKPVEPIAEPKVQTQPNEPRNQTLKEQNEDTGSGFLNWLFGD